jgi:hypothetical protein
MLCVVAYFQMVTEHHKKDLDCGLCAARHLNNLSEMIGAGFLAVGCSFDLLKVDSLTGGGMIVPECLDVSFSVIKPKSRPIEDTIDT